MRAVVRTAYGTADVLSVGEIDKPVAGSGEVVIGVRAAGLDRGAWHFMTGTPYAIRMVSGLRAPKTAVLGRDLAGVVVAIGPGVSRFSIGDEVFGIGEGSFAEFAVAAEDKLAPKPQRLTFEQAAAIPISGLTALRGLTDVGHVAAGQNVLIIGASGGVGTNAVQIAKAFGARVTGVCSAGKVDLVRSIGADAVVDYTRDDFARADVEYDLILDIAGNSSLTRLRRVLAQRGTLVIVGGEGAGKWLGVGRQLRALALSPFVRQRLTMMLAKEHHDGLDRLVELVEKGQLVPVIEKSYALEETAEAMRHLVAGNVRGKLVITP
jgi:NADPH:quinone reductase-like Zn-dependent oxidoreductase